MIRGAAGSGGGRAAAPRPQKPRRESERGNGEAGTVGRGGDRRRLPWRGASGAGRDWRMAQDDSEQTAQGRKHRVSGAETGRSSVHERSTIRQGLPSEPLSERAGVWAIGGRNRVRRGRRSAARQVTDSTAFGQNGRRSPGAANGGATGATSGLDHPGAGNERIWGRLRCF